MIEPLVNLMRENPVASIIVISIIINFIILMVTKFFTDQGRIKELKAKQKEFNKALKEVKGDMNKTLEIQKKAMEHSLELMRHSFRPLLITMLPLLLFFWWIKEIFSPVLSGWIWYYLVASIIASIILRKILDVA
jgi:uncharacterized membrane protein (DUF106 family)